MKPEHKLGLIAVAIVGGLFAVVGVGVAVLARGGAPSISSPFRQSPREEWNAEEWQTYFQANGFPGWRHVDVGSDWYFTSEKDTYLFSLYAKSVAVELSETRTDAFKMVRTASEAEAHQLAGKYKSENCFRWKKFVIVPQKRIRAQVMAAFGMRD